MMRLVAVLALLATSACGTPGATTTAPTRLGDGSTSLVAPTTTTLPPTTVPATTIQSPTSGGPPTTVAAVAAFVVSAGSIDGPPTVEVVVGTEAVFTVISEEADEVHVHGYDLTFELVPGRVVEVRFTADVPGIFEVELHGSHTVLTQVVVAP